MIQSQDRSYYIGCSDTSMVVGNWNTKTFEKWWLEKLGINKNNLSNDAIKAGNIYYEGIPENGSGHEKNLLVCKDIGGMRCLEL